MKLAYPLLILLFCLVTRPTYSQSTYTFKIDHETYNIDENQLNDLFGQGFNMLVENRRAKIKSYDYWVDSFKIYKEMALSGTFSWEVYHDRVVNHRFLGNDRPDADHGIENGKPATGDPNKEKNHPARMRLIFSIMTKYITNTVTDKQIK